MIICTKCGFQNDDTDTFCGSCAAFLEWAGEKQQIEEPEPVPVEPEPEEVPVEHGLFERVKERIVGVGEARTTSEPAVDVSQTEAEPAPVPVGAAVGGGSETAVATTVAPPLPAAPVSAAPVAAAPVTAAPVTAAPVTAAPSGPAGVPGPEMRANAPGHVDSPARPSGPTSQPAPAAPVSQPATAPISTVKSPAAPSQAAPTPTAPPQASPTTSAPAPASPAPASAAPSSSAAAAPAPAAPKATPPATPAPAQPAAVAPSAVQPSATGPVAPVQPEAVKPAAAKARPAARPKQPSERVINPGDKVCGQCGEGNDPIRKFCRRCGASLEQAVVFTPPWYRRLIHRLRKRNVRAAGERPKLRRRAFGGAGGGWITSWVTKLIALAVVVFVVLTFVGPWHHTIRNKFSTWYHDVKNAIHTTYNPVHPVGATATSAVSGHPAGNAIDDATNTSWQAGGTKSGLGETLTIELQAAANIDKIGFLNGNQDTPQAYLTEPRPETVLVTFNGPTRYSRTINLKDSASFQSFTVDAKKASSLTVTIESVYASAQGQNASIAEVELFTKS
ncbi:MAG TPA: hypothetical protein VFH56_15825 [Acidimicrobiales bacterium]|nr:hypothetical protein [Acidimicrobiales bacterium]